MPESGLETELVTADASYHLHKIVQTVRPLEELEKQELTSRSSTCCLGSSSSGQVAWPKLDMAALSDDFEKLVSKRMDASTTHAVFVIRPNGPRHSSHNPLDS